MPNAPKRFGQVKHKRRDYRPAASTVGYDWDWTKLARLYKSQHPLCEDCLDEGLTTIAREVDHKTPFHGKDDPLRLDWANLKSLCRSHHKRKTDRDKKSEGAT